MNKGKLIVLYGSNNLGKSTQAKLLVKNLNNKGYQTNYIKYPIYDLEPTGPQINEIIRGGKAQEISEEELQKIYSQNRLDYQEQLEEQLNSGINVVAEDYIGTGLAWGVTKGADLAVLEKQNEGLTKEDIMILLEGERFTEAKEEIHIHEQNDELMKKNRQVHLDLAKKYHWQIVPANGPIEEISASIWQAVQNSIDKG